jgi:hypothetical protein
MSDRSLTSLILVSLLLAFNSAPALAQDAQTCLATAQRMTHGARIGDQEKRAAHEACLHALATSSNVVHKNHLQEADSDIMGSRPKH